MSKEDTLSAKWSRKENDILYSYPSKPDGHFLHAFFSGYLKIGEFLREIEERGYDRTTIKFSIKKKEIRIK